MHLKRVWFWTTTIKNLRVNVCACVRVILISKNEKRTHFKQANKQTWNILSIFSMYLSISLFRCSFHIYTASHHVYSKCQYLNIFKQYIANSIKIYSCIESPNEFFYVLFFNVFLSIRLKLTRHLIYSWCVSSHGDSY